VGVENIRKRFRSVNVVEMEMYINGKMRPVESIPEMGERR
jgi:hypothetical protein